MLKKYPISIYEKIFFDILNKNYKLLFATATENNITDIVNDLSKRQEDKLIQDFQAYLSRVSLQNDLNGKYLSKFFGGRYGCKPTYDNFIKAKNYLFLSEVIDKDNRFIEKACITATQAELDNALNDITPNNFSGINILLKAGAKVHKVGRNWEGDRYDEIDEIGTEILKKKINDIIGD